MRRLVVLDLGLLLVALAQLLLDGLELLAQEVLALHLGHLVLGLRLDLAAQLEHFELLREDAVQPDQLLADRVDLQDFLRLLRLHAGAGRHQVGQLARARSRSWPRSRAPRACAAPARPAGGRGPASRASAPPAPGLPDLLRRASPRPGRAGTAAPAGTRRRECARCPARSGGSCRRARAACDARWPRCRPGRSGPGSVLPPPASCEVTRPMMRWSADVHQGVVHQADRPLLADGQRQPHHGVDDHPAQRQDRQLCRDCSSRSVRQHS